MRLPPRWNAYETRRGRGKSITSKVIGHFKSSFARYYGAERRCLPLMRPPNPSRLLILYPHRRFGKRSPLFSRSANARVSLKFSLATAATSLLLLIRKVFIDCKQLTSTWHRHPIFGFFITNNFYFSQTRTHVQTLRARDHAAVWVRIPQWWFFFYRISIISVALLRLYIVWIKKISVHNFFFFFDLHKHIRIRL